MRGGALRGRSGGERVWSHGGECGLGGGLAQPERAGCYSAGRRRGKERVCCRACCAEVQRVSKFSLSDAGSESDVRCFDKRFVVVVFRIGADDVVVDLVECGNEEDFLVGNAWARVWCFSFDGVHFGRVHGF